MGREVKRVPMDFDAPLDKSWAGYDMPRKLADMDECPDCDNGYGPLATNLYKQWYGNVPFDPKSKDSELFTATHPHMRRVAERNVEA
jgi:hypothetical protein